MGKRIVIIGGGTAGASAAFSARKTDRSAEITMLDKEPYPTYSRCGLPFAIKGIIPALENLIVFHDKFFSQQKINHIKNTEVIKIDPKAKTVSTKTGNFDYDSLILTTGSSPEKPPIPGADLPHVLTLRTIDDARSIVKSAESVKSTAIIGVSFIGVEIAEALHSKGITVTLIESVRTMWRAFDEDIGKIINALLATHNIKVLEHALVTGITPKKVQTKDQSIDADLVIISAGVRPNILLAKNAGIGIGKTGGIKTNEHLQTNIQNIYSAGDCAESISAITGEPITIGLGTIAARQGVVAGTNAVGERQKSPPVCNSAVIKTMETEAGSAGFTESYLKQFYADKFQTVSIMVKYPSLPHYYPGGTDIYVKLIADAKTHILLGGQILGKTSIAPRINTLALAIEKKITVDELAQADFCYSPPVADIWDPIAIAAQSLLRKIKLSK
ncbi:MAG: FAD-dependent oxidoreductase [Planctomycetes bacterium]|nr:FAD-dependent oxidoreductase [Planctomycetota bacterium]